MKIDVLDHGFVRLVETWGEGDAKIAEAGIIEAARQSTQGNFRGWDQDRGLLKYLFCSEPRHSTPFEFAGMTIEVRAPIFVFREWHRHRTQSYNEMSARYAPLPDIKYVPTQERLFLTQQSNKQAQTVGGVFLTEILAEEWVNELQDLYEEINRLYQKGLDIGIPKEVARVCLPVGQYSQMRASANLLNWFRFLDLRLDYRAQYEIRMFAEAVAQIVKTSFPETYALFEARN